MARQDEAVEDELARDAGERRAVERATQHQEPRLAERRRHLRRGWQHRSDREGVDIARLVLDEAGDRVIGRGATADLEDHRVKRRAEFRTGVAQGRLAAAVAEDGAIVLVEQIDSIEEDRLTRRILKVCRYEIRIDLAVELGDGVVPYGVIAMRVLQPLQEGIERGVDGTLDAARLAAIHLSGHVGEDQLAGEDRGSDDQQGGKCHLNREPRRGSPEDVHRRQSFRRRLIQTILTLKTDEADYPDSRPSTGKTSGE